MRTIDKTGTFEELLAGHKPEIQRLTEHLRGLIEEFDPDVVEVNRPGEGTSAYGVGEKKMSEAYAYLAPQKSWVNLGFYHGSALADPHGLIEGTGARIRHIKVRPDDPIDDEIITDYLERARRERTTALAR